MLSGSTRMTYSLAVLMLETTSNVDLFLPMTFCLFTSYGVGSFFTRSLYSGYMRSKQIPILRKDIPPDNKDVKAETIMNTPVKSFQIIESVQNVLTQIQTSSFQVWPILNSKGRIIGTINKQTLIAMVEHDCWYYPEESMP